MRWHGEEKVLKYTPILKGSDAQTKKVGRRRFSPYKFVLFAHDLITANLAFAVSAWICGSAFLMGTYSGQGGLLFLVSLLTIASFPAYRLYSYHLICSKRNHLINLLKSFGWGLLTLGITMFFWWYSHFLHTRRKGLAGNQGRITCLSSNSWEKGVNFILFMICINITYELKLLIKII